MEKNILLILGLFPLFSIGQTVTKKPAQKQSVTVPGPVLKTSEDSLSYAIGLSVAAFYKEQGIQSVNGSLVAKAISDVLKSGKPLLNEMQANTCLINYVQKQKATKAAPNKKVGETFLADNKTKPGVVTLSSGLQYEILKEGSGPKPLATDKVKCNYKGTLLDGTVFDASDNHGGPIEFPVNGVIRGWTEALQLMPVGSKWKLYIPSDLAYGDQGNAAIPPGATLIFEVELVDITK
jgi:FKBP-type peptidyl-prolyl cis-trans isomerase FklB